MRKNPQLPVQFVPQMWFFDASEKFRDGLNPALARPEVRLLSAYAHRCTGAYACLCTTACAYRCTTAYAQFCTNAYLPRGQYCPRVAAYQHQY
eukprot:810836-Rhodomonas_salina.1